ncbi:DUF1499 domain-containing protein [Aliifodinibius sp. S!AR15-10]|uniref:DUF1499 domain-containing protein n=1 Tax=Aliifodinibius sp. S!AR15-10 TaxID=2950437 RepID=UPI00286FC38B|nr:DUF1499 domain-containing protein [Aliifodinibius sp. S!AR15-10]
MASLFSACGSRSSDFNTGVEVTNPLPPCPDSPNCVRISQQYPQAIDAVWETTLSVLQAMRPYDIELSPDEYRINSVFLVVFFRDDMAVQLEEMDSTTTYLHIRSSSRVGYGDMGVNRRRVEDFLERMKKIETKKEKK